MNKLLKNEHPSWEAPFDLSEIPSDFEDISWHNDACPSWLSLKRGLRLYVDYPLEQSDMYDWPDWKRFGLCIVDDEGDFVEEGDYADTWEEIKEIINIYPIIGDPLEAIANLDTANSEADAKLFLKFLVDNGFDYHLEDEASEALATYTTLTKEQRENIQKHVDGCFKSLADPFDILCDLKSAI